MPNRPTPPRNSSAGRRTAKRSSSGFQWTPFNAMLAGFVLLFVVLAWAGVWWLTTRNVGSQVNSSPTPTPVVGGEQATSTATQAMPTLTPTPQPSPTPIACTARRNTEAHSEPKVVTIKEPVAKDRALPVFGKIEREGILWYQVTISGVLRYIPAEDVQCSVAP